MAADGKHERHPNEIYVEEIAVAYLEKLRRELVILGFPDLDLANLPDEFRRNFHAGFRQKMRDRLAWSDEEIDSALDGIETRAYEIIKAEEKSASGGTPPAMMH